MNTAYPRKPVEPGALARTARNAAIVVLVVGGGTGLLLNQTTAENRRLLLDQQRLLAAAEPVMALPRSEPVAAPEMAGGRRVLFSLRPVDVAPPPNPFEATPLPTAASSGPAGLLRGPGPLPPATGVVPAPAAAPAGPAPVAAPRADELHLTGIIQGEPPLVVVQFQGQSLFLKIGDQVADSWRLVEIKERTAVFQMGARRVEVPIKGGSSE